MEGIERVIGKLEEFKTQAVVRFDKLEQKVDSLREWKWRVLGGAAVLSSIVTVLIQVVIVVLKAD